MGGRGPLGLPPGPVTLPRVGGVAPALTVWAADLPAAAASPAAPTPTATILPEFCLLVVAVELTGDTCGTCGCAAGVDIIGGMTILSVVPPRTEESGMTFALGSSAATDEAADDCTP